MAEFLMPSLGADMEEGRLVAWLIRPGDVVRRGQIVAEVDTAKGVIDVECFLDGVVEELLVTAGGTVPVGTPLARIASAPSREVERKPSPSIPPAPVSPVITRPQPAPGAESVRVKVAPRARKRAAELHVDPAGLRGTGRAGEVTVADVEAAAGTLAAGNLPPARPTPPAPAAAAEPESSARLRGAIAAAMALSKREIPHYYLQTTIDMERATTWLAAENERRPLAQRLLPAVVYLKALARALGDVPQLNGFWIDGRFVSGPGIHIGFAIALRGGGLVAPAIHDVDTKSLDELMAELHELIPRTRRGRLRSSELSDPTITLTNLGDLGVEAVWGVIYPPQVAIVGLGRTTPRPWVADGALIVRPVLTATLAADHRASDGMTGARLLTAFQAQLQQPEAL